MEQDRATPIFLTVPGLNNSGPDHWQSLWEQRIPGTRRVEQTDWEQPRRDQWVSTVQASIPDAGGPVILIAHSLGCIAVASWAAAQSYGQSYGRPVAGALLVAPPAIDRAGAHPLLRQFAPLPSRPLPFPSILVASRNDQYATLEQSLRMARIWQSHFVDIGYRGHINAASGLGIGGERPRLLDQVVDAARRRQDMSRRAQAA